MNIHDDEVGFDELIGEEPSTGWSLAGLNRSVTEEDAWRTWATRLFWYSVVVTIALILTGFWDHLDRRVEKEAFALPMEMHADGRVVVLQPPKTLRELVVAPQAIQYMLARVVVDLRRLSADTPTNEDSRRNVLASACSAASKTVTTPAVREADLVVVNLESVHSGASSAMWHAEWQETWLDKRQMPKGEHRFRGDFQLSRREIDWTKPDAMARFLRSPLPICVESVLVHEVTTR